MARHGKTHAALPRDLRLHANGRGSFREIEILRVDVRSRRTQRFVQRQREIRIALFDVEVHVSRQAALHRIVVGAVPLEHGPLPIARLAARRGFGGIDLRRASGGILGGDGNHILTVAKRRSDIVSACGNASFVTADVLSVHPEIHAGTNRLELEEEPLSFRRHESLPVEHPSPEELFLSPPHRRTVV